MKSGVTINGKSMQEYIQDTYGYDCSNWDIYDWYSFVEDEYGIDVSHAKSSCVEYVVKVKEEHPDWVCSEAPGRDGATFHNPTYKDGDDFIISSDFYEMAVDTKNGGGYEYNFDLDTYYADYNDRIDVKHDFTTDYRKYYKENIGVNDEHIRVEFDDEGYAYVYSDDILLKKSSASITRSTEMDEFFKESVPVVNSHKTERLKQLRSKIFERYGDVDGLDISYNENGQVVVSSSNLVKPIVVEYDEDVFQMFDVVDYALSYDAAASSDNKINVTLFNLEQYIKKGIGDGNISTIKNWTYDFNPNTGEFYLYTENEKFLLTADDINDPEHSKIINAIIQNGKLEKQLRAGGAEANISMMQNENGSFEYICTVNGTRKTYEMYTDDDGNVRYREVEYDSHGEKQYGETFSSIEEAYEKSEQASKPYYSDNKRLSRRQNKAISDFDEAAYKEITSNLGKINLASDVQAASSAIETLSQYMDNPPEFSASEGLSMVDSNINFLNSAIDAIVNLYIICDRDMKKLLDGILNNDGALADWIFDMKETYGEDYYRYVGDDYKEKFQQEFEEKYKEYVEDVKKRVQEIADVAENGFYIGNPDEIPKDVQTKLEQMGIKVKNGYIDADTYCKVFGDYIEDFYGDKKLLSSLKDTNGNAFDESVYDMLIANPLTIYMGALETYTNNKDVIESYRDLETVGTFVEFMFEDEYRACLQEVRETGQIDMSTYGGDKRVRKLEDSLLTPAEFAMDCYLSKLSTVMVGVGSNNDPIKFHDSNLTPEKLVETYCGENWPFKFGREKGVNYYGEEYYGVFDVYSMIDDTGLIRNEECWSAAFDKYFDYKIRERQGKEDAIKYVEEMIKGGITWEDILKRFGDGFGDGALKIFRGLLHLGDYDNFRPEWEEKYIAEYIASAYDYEDLVARYKNGEFSQREFELLAKLSGSELYKTGNSENKISDYDKSQIAGYYSLGSSAGEVVYKLVESYLLGPFGKAGSTIIGAIIKGASTAGEVYNSTWNSMIIKEADGNFHLNALSRGAAVTLITILSFYCKQYVKGKFKLKEPDVNVPESRSDRFDVASGTGSQKSMIERLLNAPDRVKDGFKETIENAIPFSKFFNNMWDYGVLGSAWMTGIAAGSDILKDLTKYMSDLYLADGYFINPVTGEKVAEIGYDEKGNYDPKKLLEALWKAWTGNDVIDEKHLKEISENPSQMYFDILAAFLEGGKKSSEYKAK